MYDKVFFLLEEHWNYAWIFWQGVEWDPKHPEKEYNVLFGLIKIQMGL